METAGTESMKCQLWHFQGAHCGCITCNVFNQSQFFFILKILFIYFEREGKGGRKKRETAIGCFSHAPNLACKPCTSSDWESNWQTLDCKWAFIALSHTSQGQSQFFLSLYSIFQRFRSGKTKRKNPAVHLTESQWIAVCLTLLDLESCCQPLLQSKGSPALP